MTASADPGRITKMSAAGNDFVVVHGTDADALGDRLGAWIRAVSRRGLSVGADGVLAVDRVGPDRVRVRFWNPDGSVAFCGNGTRCAARFARRERLAAATMTLETAVGEVPAEVRDDDVRLVLPPPRDRGELEVEVDGVLHRGRFVVAGVPHFVIAVGDVASAPLESWGPALRRHAAFGADGVNVDLVSAGADGVHDLRTWERGVEAETLACGTGAVATAAALCLGGGPLRMHLRPRSGARIEIVLGGERDRFTHAEMVGDARFVFDGRLDREALGG